MARDLGLPVHDKPDSQEICFVPGDDYLKFVRERLPGLDTSGPLLDEDGSILAQHSGIEGFTIGQRRGLGGRGRRTAICGRDRAAHENGHLGTP